MPWNAEISLQILLQCLDLRISRAPDIIFNSFEKSFLSSKSHIWQEVKSYKINVNKWSFIGSIFLLKASQSAHKFAFNNKVHKKDRVCLHTNLL